MRATILLVEDEHSIGQLVHDYLSDEGYAVVRVRGGGERPAGAYARFMSVSGITSRWTLIVPDPGSRPNTTRIVPRPYSERSSRKT